LHHSSMLFQGVEVIGKKKNVLVKQCEISNLWIPWAQCKSIIIIVIFIHREIWIGFVMLLCYLMCIIILRKFKMMFDNMLSCHNTIGLFVINLELILLHWTILCNYVLIIKVRIPRPTFWLSLLAWGFIFLDSLILSHPNDFAMAQMLGLIKVTQTWIQLPHKIDMHSWMHNCLKTVEGVHLHLFATFNLIPLVCLCKLH
jgi:hypothetical protein